MTDRGILHGTYKIPDGRTMSFSVLPEDKDVEFSVDGGFLNTSSFRTIRGWHKISPANWQPIIDALDGLGGASFLLTVNTN